MKVLTPFIRYVFVFCMIAMNSTFMIASDTELLVLPSFTLDVDEGPESAGFTVHCTNTSLNIDETCGTTVVYDWSLNNGVQGVDWIFVEGTSSTTTDLAIEFINQGCYLITLNATDCNNSSDSAPQEITVAGAPEIFVNDFTSTSTCSNGLAEALWQMASNNNNTINFEIFIDGVSLFSNTYNGLSFCTTPGQILFADVISAGFLSAGWHQLLFVASGDVYTTPTTLFIDFEVFEAPVLSLNSDELIFCESSEALIQANINFGLAPYVVDWSIGGLSQLTETVTGTSTQFSFDLSGLSSPDNYILVSLIDSNGCTSFETIYIEVYPDVEFNLATIAVCDGTEAEFTATGNATFYEWDESIFTLPTNPVPTSDGIDIQSATIVNGTPISVVGYIFYPDAFNGGFFACTSTQTVDAIVFTNPNVTLHPANNYTYCANENPQIFVGGADDYSFSPAAESQSGPNITFPSNIPVPAIITMTGTNDYGSITCSSTLQFEFEILASPDVQLAVDGAVMCGNDDAFISTGGMDPSIYSFEWWLNGTALSSTNNSILLPFTYPADAGVSSITCQVTNNFNCIGSSVIEVEILENASITLDTPVICEGDAFEINITSNATSVFWDSNGFTTTPTGISYYPVVNGAQYVATANLNAPSILTGGNFNCVATAIATVDMRDNPVLDFVFSGAPCTGQSVQVDINGAQNYSWISSPSETNSSVNPDGGNPEFNILSLGYTDVILGNLEIDATGSITYADANNLICSTFDSFINTINSSTIFDLVADTEICEGECIEVNIDWSNNPGGAGGAGNTYDWYLDGVLFSNDAVFNYCPTITAGTTDISLTVNEGNACENSEGISINTSQLPVITMSADVNEGCSPLAVNFTSTSTNAGVTAWNFGNGETETGVSNIQMIFDCDDYSSGDCNYQVSFTAISPTNPNCITAEFVDIITHPNPISDFFLNESVICFDAAGAADINANNISSELLGQNCTTGVSPYRWTLFPTGTTDCTDLVGDEPDLTAGGTGSFSIGLLVTDTFGCSSESFQDFTVADAPIPEIAFLQTSVCIPTVIEIHNTTTGAATFELEIPGFTIPTGFSSPYFLDINYPGVYEAEFTVTSIEGCSVTIEIDDAFAAWNPPVADFTTLPETVNILDPIVEFLNLSLGGTEFIWSFGDGDGSSEVNPEHEYYMAGEYQVQLHVTNEYGCTDVATQIISVDNLLQVYVPNAFTPNNDGNNDAWMPVITGQELISEYECWVFDRWGKMVHHSTTPGEAWIGNNVIDGEGTHFVSSSESFSWRIKIKKIEGRGAETFTGHVILVR